MKTIKFLLSAIIVISGSMIQAQDYKVNAEKSKLKWTGEKLTGKHHGLINIKDGSLTLKKDKITSGMFVIDMTSIIVKDIEDADYNKKLVGHLKSDDFFGVEKFPEAKLKVTKATAFKSNKADVRADLTIKGKTNSVLFSVTKNDSGYKAKITIDRSKFDVKYGSKSFFDNLGDKVINDEFILEVDLVAEAK